MSERPDENGGAEASSARLARKIARHRARRERARRRPVGNLWRQVARVGTLGWMVVLPIAAGAVLGHLLDRRLDSGITWALAFIMLGVAVAGYSLWRMIGEDEADLEADAEELRAAEHDEGERR
ncbi:MAG: AtpZ/AtpI family protein [Myxococcales bacterium]|nr:AtpZ/AtpI family protein [Myxococcales bacterium]